MATDQTKIEWPQLLDEALTAPGNLGNVYSRFRDYSITNMMLFRMQGVREPVASYSRWKQLGRQVVKGAKAKEVIVPILSNEKPPEDEPMDEKRERVARLIGFKVVRAVFTLSDTDGDYIPPTKPQGWRKEIALPRLGIREVYFNSLDGNQQGWSRGLDFAINPMAVHPNKTPSSMNLGISCWATPSHITMRNIMPIAASWSFKLRQPLTF